MQICYILCGFETENKRNIVYTKYEKCRMYEGCNDFLSGVNRNTLIEYIMICLCVALLGVINENTIYIIF